MPAPPIRLPRGRGAKKKAKPNLLAKYFMESRLLVFRCRLCSWNETKSARSSPKVFRFEAHRDRFRTPPLRFAEMKVSAGPSPGKPNVLSQ
eukprot:4258878-Pleurochrysis_carterae.AAC.1